MSCQNERSQLQNKDEAMQILAARLAEVQRQERLEQLSDIRGEQRAVGFGSQIRTYMLRRTSWSRTSAPATRPATCRPCSTATSTASWRRTCSGDGPAADEA